MITLQKVAMHYITECTYLNTQLDFVIDTGCTKTVISGLSLCNLYNAPITALVNLFDNLDKDKVKLINTANGEVRSFTIKTNDFSINNIQIPNFKLSITDNFNDDVRLLGMDIINALEGVELFKGQNFLYYNFNLNKYYDVTAFIQTYARLEDLCGTLVLNKHPYIEVTKLQFDQIPSELKRLRMLFGNLPDKTLLDRAYAEFYQ